MTNAEMNMRAENLAAKVVDPAVVGPLDPQTKEAIYGQAMAEAKLLMIALVGDPVG